VRWRRIEEEYGDQIEIEWRSFLLRPNPPVSGRPRDLETFRAYTQSWLRPDSEPDSGDFRLWEGDEGPPSHSIPAHQVSKWAARLGRDSFERIHERLLTAYFSENRDISSPAVLEACWIEAGLPEDAFAGWDDPEITRQILAEHEEALSYGTTGVPAARLVGNDAIIVGAHPLELYRRWIDRTLERAAGDES
jgi:predicted DsbA family dithiol-disulfide isomerase